MQEVNLNNQRKAKASMTSSSAATEEAKPERVSALCKMLKNKHLPLEARIKVVHLTLDTHTVPLTKNQSLRPHMTSAC